MKMITQQNNPKPTRALTHRQRGMALLLVMIGLVICTLLVAGFLQSQGTAIGIARNERDGEKARAVAQSGIDLCYWQVRNRSDWRSAMSPGKWLNAAAVGDGTVTVTATSGDGTNSFINDTTQPVILTSVGTVAGRTFTLTGTIGPTGGGTIYRGGNYCQGRIVLGNNDLNGLAVVDSYNSSVAPYNALFPGFNANFGTGYSGNYGLLVYFLSAFRGTFTGSTHENIGNAVYGTLGAVLPVSTSISAQPYTLGTVVIPNTSGLAPKGAVSRSSSGSITDPGQYDQITLNANGALATTTTISASGTYHITGNLTINSLASLAVSDGVNAVVIVDGNLTVTGAIKLTGAATLTLYVNGNVTMNGTSAMNVTGGNTSNFTLFGTGSGSITMNSTSQIVGAIYAPTSSMLMQSSSPKVYGAIITHDLTLANSSAFHFDENLRNKMINNITGGSAPAGTANYNVTITGSTTVGSH